MRAGLFYCSTNSIAASLTPRRETLSYSMSWGCVRSVSRTDTGLRRRACLTRRGITTLAQPDRLGLKKAVGHLSGHPGNLMTRSIQRSDPRPCRTLTVLGVSAVDRKAERCSNRARIVLESCSNHRSGKLPEAPRLECIPCRHFGVERPQRPATFVASCAGHRHGPRPPCTVLWQS